MTDHTGREKSPKNTVDPNDTFLIQFDLNKLQD